MKRASCLSLIIFIIAYPAMTQDTLVSYKELVFSSPVEKKALDDHFLNKKTDLFLLFMANGSLLKESSIAAAKKRFYDYLEQISANKLNGKKNEKKVKFLYDNLHQAFLTKYEMKNHFEDIFYNGYYNCVSGTALYGLAFDHLDIPFSVKQKPTHVYLVAYPEDERVLVETTIPTGGFIAMNPQFKQNFIKTLKDQKLISAQEFIGGNVDDLFDKYYFGEQENITMLQLLGLQYFNDGLYRLEEEQHLDALHQLEKAYLFYPSERIGYMIMVAAHEAFKKREVKDTIHATYLAKLARCKKYGITSDMIEGEFARVMEDLLFNRGETEKLEAYYNTLQSALDDEALRNEIKFFYNFENARLLYNQAKFRESLKYYEECLKIKPQHQDANRIFLASIAQSLKNSSNQEVLKTLEAYSSKYPMLLENNLFNEMLGSTYLLEIEMNFKLNKPEDGERYKTMFETFQKNHSEVTFDSHLIGVAYSAVAVFYFKKGQTTKAKTVIEKGLALSPNNYELLTRKRMIE